MNTRRESQYPPALALSRHVALHAKIVLEVANRAPKP